MLMPRSHPRVPDFIDLGFNLGSSIFQSSQGIQLYRECWDESCKVESLAAVPECLTIPLLPLLFFVSI